MSIMEIARKVSPTGLMDGFVLDKRRPAYVGAGLLWGRRAAAGISLGSGTSFWA